MPPLYKIGWVYKMKNILKYSVIFFATISVLIALLLISALIPKNSIINNLNKSAEFFKGVNGINRRTIAKEYETVHYYADSILLNIILNIDSNRPIESIFEAKYYEHIKADVNDDFINAITNGLEANQQYLRYWHGTVSLIRPLLILFSINQIYTINKILFTILLLILTIILFKKSKILSVVFLISCCIATLHITTMCIEYFSTVLIMLIISIIAVLIERNGNKNLYVLFFVSGILTCFFDFLTTETLTILIPVMFVVLIRYKENRIKDFKSELKFLIISFSLWGIAYISTWITKWILSSIILKINALDYVKDNLMMRINWNGKNKINYEVIKNAILLNLRVLYPLNRLKIMHVYIVLSVLVGFATLLQIINIIDGKNNWINYILALIGIIPYIRFGVLINHSYNHYFFTFRAQLTSIIALICIIIINIKTLKIQKGEKNERKRLYYTNTSKK